jgi:hypothetical protein
MVGSGSPTKLPPPPTGQDQDRAGFFYVYGRHIPHRHIPHRHIPHRHIPHRHIPTGTSQRAHHTTDNAGLPVPIGLAEIGLAEGGYQIFGGQPSWPSPTSRSPNYRGILVLCCVLDRPVRGFFGADGPGMPKARLDLQAKAGSFLFGVFGGLVSMEQLATAKFLALAAIKELPGECHTSMPGRAWTQS